MRAPRPSEADKALCRVCRGRCAERWSRREGDCWIGNGVTGAQRRGQSGWGLELQLLVTAAVLGSPTAGLQIGVGQA